MKRSRRRSIDREAALAWKIAVTGKHGGYSMLSDGAAEIAHHAIDQQALRRRAKDLGIDADWLLWDPRVGVPLTDREHVDHHSWKRRLTLDELPDDVWRFAADYGLEYWLERHHVARAAA